MKYICCSNFLRFATFLNSSIDFFTFTQVSYKEEALVHYCLLQSDSGFFLKKKVNINDTIAYSVSVFHQFQQQPKNKKLTRRLSPNSEARVNISARRILLLIRVAGIIHIVHLA